MAEKIVNTTHTKHGHATKAGLQRVYSYIFISLIILFIKFALQNKSYRINNIDLKVRTARTIKGTWVVASIR